MNLLKISAPFAMNLMLKNDSQVILLRPSRKTSIDFMKKIYRIML